MMLSLVATGYIKERTDKEAGEGFCQRGTMSVYLALQEKTNGCTVKNERWGRSYSYIN